MIIWINGAFGSGKTQTAYELHRRIAHSFVYDPEEAGYFIRKNMPKDLQLDDFQDYPMWRTFNYAMLSHISQQYEGIIIVPMTIVHPRYFEEIVGRLRDNGVETHHFALLASKEVLLRRLRSRGDSKHSWPAQQIDRCIEGLSNASFERYIDTNHKTIDDVVEEIACAVNLRLLPDQRGALHKFAARMMTKIRHIRF